MITKEEILAFLKAQKSEFHNEFNIVRIGIFGSYAGGTQSEASDIDILVEFEPKTENLTEKKSNLRAILKAQFNKEIDICREKYIKPYFKKQILESAIYAFTEDEIPEKEADEILAAFEDVKKGNYLTHKEVLKQLTLS